MSYMQSGVICHSAAILNVRYVRVVMLRALSWRPRHGCVRSPRVEAAQSRMAARLQLAVLWSATLGVETAGWTALLAGQS